jgi:hypothetical protein
MHAKRQRAAKAAGKGWAREKGQKVAAPAELRRGLMGRTPCKIKKADVRLVHPAVERAVLDAFRALGRVADARNK